MFDDVGKTIKVILYDRITSPLFGTFILSWCGWNWRLIILFLTDSSTTVVKKFQFLDSDLYPSNCVTFIYGFLLPATTTAFFIYIYPWFARKVYGYWRQQQNELKKLQVEKDGEKPLNQKDKEEIMNRALLSEFRYQEEREKRESRIKDLENLVKSLQADGSLSENSQKEPTSLPIAPSQHEQNPKATKKYSSEIKTGMFSLLSMMDKLAKGSSIGRDEILQHASGDEILSKLEQTVVLHCLDNLVAEKYVTWSMGNLYVEPKGREAIVHKSFGV